MEATYVSDRLIRCYAPHADMAGGGAGLTKEWVTDFDDGLLPPNSILLGTASIVDGSLKLTDNVGQRNGSFVLEPVASR